jgi:capsid protein
VYQRLIRCGLLSQSEALREAGYDPDQTLAEIAEDNAKLDKLKLILDSDPRNTTQQGNPRQSGLTAGANVSTFEEPPEPEPEPDPKPPVNTDKEEDTDEEE